MNRLSPGTSPGIFKVLTVAILSFAMLTMPLASAAAMSFRSAASTPPTKSEAKKNATSSDDMTAKQLFVDPPAARPEAESFIQPVAPPVPPGVFTATLVGVLTATGNNTAPPADAGKADPGDTISYTAILDNQTGADATALSFTIPIDSHTTLSGTPLNSTPVAFDVAQTPFNEDAAPVTITLAGQDPDGSNLTFSTVTSPTKGSLGAIGVPTCGAAGCTATVSYTPTANANGSDSFTYRVNDGTANSNQNATVSITINSVNDAPTFTLPAGDPPPVNEDVAAQTVSNYITAIRPAQVGDSNEDSQTVSFEIVSNSNPTLFTAAGVQLVVNAGAYPKTANLTYTPAANQNGTATITYHLKDNGCPGSPGVPCPNGGVDTSSPDRTFTITVNAVNDAPTVTNKAYTPNAVMANMKRTGFTGLLSGITDVDAGVNGCNPTFSIKAGSISATSPVGGTVSNVDLANGTFDFDPPPGTTGDVTFTYIVSDNGCPLPAADSAPVTVTINVSGPVIWFVKPPSAAPAAGGDGRLSNPFNRMLEATNAMGTNASQRIFVYNNGFATIAAQNVTLQGAGTQAAAQWLIGQGAVAASFDALMGISVPANTIARPPLGANATAANALRPTIQGQVTMKENTRVEGFNSNVGAGLKGLTGSSWAAGGAITIKDVSVTSTNSNAVDFTNASLSGQTLSYTSSDTTNSPNTISSTGGIALNVSNATLGTGFTFKSISATGGTKGISLNNTGANGLTVSGTGTTAGSGGTIQNTSNNGAEFKTAQNISLSNMNFTNTAQTQAVAGNSASCGGAITSGNNLSCVAGLYFQAVTGVTLTKVSVTGTKQMGINGNNVTTFTMSNSTITGNGDEVFEDGLNFINLKGTSSITDTIIKDNAARQVALSNMEAGSTLTLNITGTRTNNVYPAKDTSTTEIGKTTQTNTNTDQSLLVDLPVTGTTVTVALNLTGVVFNNSLPGNSVLINPAATSGTFSGTATNCSFDNTGGGVIIQAQNGMNGSYNVTNSEFNNVNLQSILYAGANPYNGAFTGTASGNHIGEDSNGTTAGQACQPLLTSNCHGIDVNFIGGSGSISTRIASNTIQQFGGTAISVKAASNQSADVNVNIVSNTIKNPTGFTPIGISTNIGLSANLANPDDNVDGCLGIGGAGALKNTITGTYDSTCGCGSTFGIVTNVRFLSHHRLPGYGGSATAVGGSGNAVTDYIIANNTIGASQVFTQRGNSGDYPGGAACLTPLLLADGGIESSLLNPQSPFSWASYLPKLDSTANSKCGAGSQDSSTFISTVHERDEWTPPSTVPANVVANALNQQQLDSIVAAAIERWSSTGLTAAQISIVKSIKFELADLEGSYLGQADGNRILVDRKAGGKGWFIDTTPQDDSEFATNFSSTRFYSSPFAAPAGRVDLLTAIEHEIGHFLKLPDTYAQSDRDDLMYGYLTVGERRLPINGQAAKAIADLNTTGHFLSLVSSEESLAAEIRSAVDSASNQSISISVVAANVNAARALPDGRVTAPNPAGALLDGRATASNSVGAFLDGRATGSNASDTSLGVRSLIGSSLIETSLSHGSSVSAKPADSIASAVASATMFMPTPPGSFPINGTGSGFKLPTGKSTTITFQVTVKNPPNFTGVPPATPQISHQGTLQGSIGTIVTDNPTTGTANDATVTLVDLFNSATAVTSSSNPSNTSQPVTFTATITATGSPDGSATNRTGTVVFKDGGNPITCTGGNQTLTGSGVATCQVATLSTGNHTITAEYSGDGNFDPSNGSLNTNPQVVGQSGTSVTLTSSLNPAVVTQNITFTATVTSTTSVTNPTGTVTFKDGGNPITCTGGSQTLNGSGVATCQISTLSIGNHTITADYSGDTNFSANNGTALTAGGGQNGNPQVITQATPTVTLVSSLNPSLVTENVTFTATVAAPGGVSGTPGGTLIFKDGGSPITCSNAGGQTLSGGVGTCQIATLAAGNHTITVDYSGNTNFAAVNGTAMTANAGQNGNPQVVNKSNTTTTLSPSPASPSTPGSPVTFTATVTSQTSVTGPPAGTVQFFDGANPITCTGGGESGTNTGETLVSGTATCTTSTLTTAVHSITATYTGNGSPNGSAVFNGSTSSALSYTTGNPCSNSVVVANTNDSGSGSLRAAIASVCDGGTVTFNPVAFAPPASHVISLTSGELLIAKNLTITGPGATVLTVERNTGAATQFRVFEINAGNTVNISGMTITKGHAADGTNGTAGTSGSPGTNGGAGTPSPNSTGLNGVAGGNGGVGDNGTIGGNGNPGANGGGILNSGVLTLSDVVVANNSAGNGGAGGAGGAGSVGGNGGNGGDGGPAANVADPNTDGGTGGNAGNGGNGGNGGGGGAAGSGGGIYNTGTLTLRNTTVSANQTGAGGAGGAAGTFAAAGTIGNAGLKGTGGASGTGTDGANGTPGAAGSNGTAGTAGANAHGGGVYSTGTLNIFSSTVSGNTATDNGGGIAETGTAGSTLTNSTISGNFANNNGGGLYHDSSTAATLTSVTISNNFADNDADGSGIGGGIKVVSGSVVLKNTIVAGNFNEDGVTDSADDVSGIINDLSSFNLIGIDTGMPGNISNGSQGNQIGSGTPIDAKLDPLAFNGGPTQTHALQPTSPAIDTGNSFNCFCTLLTTLNGAIDNVTTSVTVADASKITNNLTILVDNEQMIVTGKAGNVLTVTRGANSTTPAAHLDKANVFAKSDQRGFTRTVNFDTVNPPPGDDTDIGAYERQLQAGPPNPPVLDPASDTGVVGDNTTADTSPTFNISGVVPGALVELLRDGNPVTGTQSPVAGGSGTAVGTTIQLTDPNAPAGSYTYSARQTVGGTSVSPESSPLTPLTIDTTTPATPDAPDLTAASDSFGVGTTGTDSDNLTNATAPVFNIGNVTSGFTVDLLRDGVVVATGVASGSSILLTDTTNPPAGLRNYTSRQTNGGNTTSSTTGLDVTFDRTAPAAPNTPDLQAASDSFAAGTSGTNSDNITNAATRAFDVSFTAESGSAITLLRDGNPVTGATAAGDSSPQTVADSDVIGDNVYLYKSRHTDKAGNSSESASALSVTFDATVVASTPDLQAASDSFGAGTSGTNSDDLTRTTPRSFSIASSELGSVVELLRGGTPIASTSGTGSGLTLSDSTVLADGPYSYQTRQTDGAGNTLTSVGLIVTIDTTGNAPGTPDLQAGSDTGTSSTDNRTSNASRSFDIASLNGALVELLRDGTVVSSATAAGASVTLTDSASLPDGLYHYTARQTDPAGNGPTASAGTLDVTIDTTAPSVSSVTRANASPTNATSVDFTVTFNEPVTGVDPTDFVTSTSGGLTGESITGVTGTGAVYTVSVNTGTGDGTIRLDVVNDNTIKDVMDISLSGGFNTGQVYTISKSDPVVVSITRVESDPTNLLTVHFTVNFSKPVTGVNIGANSDFVLTDVGNSITGESITGLSGSGAVYTVTVNTGTAGDGTLRLDVTDDDTIVDSGARPLGSPGAGNGNFITGEVFTIDKTKPTITVVKEASQPDPTTGPTSTTVINFTVTFGESVSGFDSSDISLAGGTAGATVANVTGSGTTYNVGVEGMTTTGTVKITVPADAGFDSAGNGNLITPSNTATVNYIRDDFATFVVNSKLDTDNGLCEPVGTNNGCTLREAINAANTDAGAETISFDSNVFTIPGPHVINLTGALPDLSTDMTINGPGANVLTVKRNTAPNYRIFTITSGNVTIDAVTISNGNSAGLPSDAGGGILNLSSGTVNITNSTISGNSGIGGGGGILQNTGTLNITNSTISGNSGVSGGGIFLNGGLTNITNSTISGNFATGDGGGLRNSFGTLTIIDSTITNNRADNDNNGSGAGGGILRGGTSTVILRSTIVAGNFNDASPSTTPDDIFGTMDASSSFNLIGNGGSGGLQDFSVDPTPAHQNKVGVSNPGLDVLADNGGPTMTHALQCTSPAIDKGNAFGQPKDQRGFTRAFDFADSVYPDAAGGDGTDIGALETQSGSGCLPIATPPASTTTTAEDTAVTIQLKGTFSQNTALTFTITDPPDHGSLGPISAPVCTGTTPQNCTADVQYTPALNYNGPDVFKFKVSAGALDSDEADVPITITAVNDPPVANNQTPNTDEEVPIPIILSASDGDNDPLTWTVLTNPTGGVLSGTAPNLTYTPNPNFFGPDSFTFRVNDGTVNSNTATVSITVNPVNDAPVNTVPGTQNTPENFTLVFSLGTGNRISIADIDAGSNAVQVTLTATNGVMTLNGTAGLVFSPINANNNGVDDATLNFSGSITNINNALNGMIFKPTPGYSGPASIQIVTNDQGRTGSGGALSDSDTVDINVLEGGTLALSSATYTVDEAAGTATITVNRTGGSSGITTVDYATSNGTAVAGVTEDYTTASGTLTFADGVTTRTFTIPINNDALDEADETINIAVSNVTGSGVLGAPATAVLTITDNDPPPSISINDVSQFEGNSGTTSFTFTVSLSAPAGQAVTVNYATANGTATAPSDYTAIPTTLLTFNPLETSKTVTVLVNGDTNAEVNESFFVNLSGAVNATISDNQGVGLINSEDTPVAQLSSSTYSVNEGGSHVTIAVTRVGDLTQPLRIDYATSDPSGLNACSQITSLASQRCDYATVVGTLRFAAGESTKSIVIPIVDDVYIEGDETFTINLSNVVGGELGTPLTGTITIVDNDSVPAPNPISNDAFFIRQLYIDLLGRLPEPGAVNNWLAILDHCAIPSDPVNGCDRIAVAAGFLRSQEFQGRGYFVYRHYSAVLGRIPLYSEFIPDMAKVNGFLSDTDLEANKIAYTNELMNRPEFHSLYDSTINNPTAFVDKLLQVSNLPNHPSRNAWISGLTNSTLTRAQVVRQFIDSTEVYTKYVNEAFIIMNYFGFLRRSADGAYQAWFTIFNNSNDYRLIINGFMNSAEYRLRFGPTYP